MPDDQDGPFTEVDRLRAQQAALAQFGLFAFHNDDVEAVLHRACEVVSDELRVEFVKILQLLPEEGDLLVRAGVNWRPGVVGRVTFGAGTDSPAGYALLHDEPVVSRDLATETRFAIPPVLTEHGVRSAVNVVIPAEEGPPFGVLEVDAPRHRDFDGGDVTFLTTYANLLSAAIARADQQAALRASVRQADLLVQELAHRVRNMLGLVQSLAAQTTAEGPGALAYRDQFLGRLQALARAEALVFEDHAQHLDLAALVPRALEPFRADRPDVLVMEGATLWLPARMGRILGLVLHELATNATKHGALSVPEGRVRLGWEVEEGEGACAVRLRWIEEGGPPVEPSSRQGFGTRLVTTLAEYELDGRAALEHRREGVRYELAFEVPR